MRLKSFNLLGAFRSPCARDTLPHCDEWTMNQKPIRSAGVRCRERAERRVRVPLDRQTIDPTGSGHFIQRLAICKCTPILVPSLSVN